MMWDVYSYYMGRKRMERGDGSMEESWKGGREGRR